MVYFKKVAYKGKYQDDQAIPDVINYITRPDKTPSQIIYGVHVDMQNISESMIEVSKRYGKYSRLRLHHYVLSFDPVHKKNPELLAKVAVAVCDYIGRCYQIVASLHEDTLYPHVHFVFNAVSFVNGYKYHGGIGEYKELENNIRTILSTYGLYPLAAVNYKPTPLDPHE
jgi:hypothetical protein